MKATLLSTSVPTLPGCPQQRTCLESEGGKGLIQVIISYQDGRDALTLNPGLRFALS